MYDSTRTSTPAARIAADFRLPLHTAERLLACNRSGSSIMRVLARRIGIEAVTL